jgi:hypothetical protein
MTARPGIGWSGGVDSARQSLFNLADDPDHLRYLRQALDGDAGPRTEAVRDRLDRS